MANAILVHSIGATVGNAILVHSIGATATPPQGNAILVHSIGATATPPQGNAILVHSIGATVSGSAPIADAGPDQTVEPWSTVTLTGAASTGTALTYTWTQAAGGTAPLVGTGATRTFAAPASMGGDSLLFSLSVTDNAGLVSTTDAVVVTVPPATEFIRRGGVWVPVQILRRGGGTWV